MSFLKFFLDRWFFFFVKIVDVGIIDWRFCTWFSLDVICLTKLKSNFFCFEFLKYRVFC